MSDEAYTWRNPDDVPANQVGGVQYTPAPGQPTPAPAPEQAVEVPERWAFSSRTVQRIAVAGIMFYVAQNHAALVQYLPQDLAADTVKMVFDMAGTLFLGAAARARQIGATSGPERIYWLPRRRAA